MTSGKRSKELRRALTGPPPTPNSPGSELENATLLAQHQTEFPFTRSSFFHGPLPPPDTLAEYKLVNPSFPERIMVMAETEQHERHEDDKESRRGEARAQWMLFSLGVVALVVAVPIAIWSNAAAGAVVGLGAILSPVAAKIWYQKANKSSDDKDKQ